MIGNYAKAMTTSVWMRTLGGKGELSQLLAKTAKIEPGALSEDTCRRLIRIFEENDQGNKSPFIWRDSERSDTRIWCFEEQIGGLIQEFEIERRVKAVEQYTGRKINSWCLMANRVVPTSGNKGSGGGMHRDSPFSHQIKYIWYLNDVNTLNGPFQYLQGTNVNLMRSRRNYPLGKTRFHELNETFEEVTGRAGTMLVCDTKCIHGGKPIVEGSRYAVTLYTFAGAQSVGDFLRKSGLLKVQENG